MSSVLLAACSGLPKSSTGGGGPYTISVTVSGLTGTGLVLLDNNTDKLTITGNGTFPFATTIAKNALSTRARAAALSPPTSPSPSHAQRIQ